ncbi:MAG: D-alanyl-D-alanine carboxypeptidase [Pseudomonadota bacterium]
MMSNLKDRALSKAAIPCLFYLVFFFASSHCFAENDTPSITSRFDKFIDNGGYILGGDNEPIAAANADTLFVPASILKIVTSLGALHILGPDFRFHTEFYLSGDNDLYIKGFGDPFLTSEEITIIIRKLETLGAKEINNIFLDGGAFQLEKDVDGRENSLNPYDAANSAIAANFNTLHLKKSPNGAIVSAEAQTPTLPIMGRLGRQLPPGTHRINLTNKAVDTFIHTGELFRAIQKKMGLAGKGIIGPRAVPADITLFYSHPSNRSLEQVISGLMLYSNNFIANQLYLACGTAKEGYPATWSKSRRAFQRFLTSLGLTEKDIVMVEGSGLSRSNLVTPAAMLKILRAFEPHDHLLAIKEGNMIKSGTLTGVYCYAGFFPGDKNGKPFVIMLNQPKNHRDDVLKLLEKISRQS